MAFDEVRQNVRAKIFQIADEARDRLSQNTGFNFKLGIAPASNPDVRQFAESIAQRPLFSALKERRSFRVQLLRELQRLRAQGLSNSTNVQQQQQELEAQRRREELERKRREQEMRELVTRV